MTSSIPTLGSGAVFLKAQRRLVEVHPKERDFASLATVEACGSGVVLQIGARVTVRTQGASRNFAALAQNCFELFESIPERDALLLPLLAEALCGLRHADPDLGTGLVVSGSDLRAELLLKLLPGAGARFVVNLRTQEAPSPVADVDLLIRGGPESIQEELVTHLRREGRPALVLDTTGRANIILPLLAAVPEYSSVVLLERRVSDPASVNFYRDVHRKNLRIIGISAHSLKSRDLEAAFRLLAGGRVDSEAFGIVELNGPKDSAHSPEGTRWVILPSGGDELRVTH